METSELKRTLNRYFYTLSYLEAYAKAHGTNDESPLCREYKRLISVYYQEIVANEVKHSMTDVQLDELYWIGLGAYIDLTKCDTSGKLWAYAGFNPQNKGKGWSKNFKIICWRAGNELITQANPQYLNVYSRRLTYEKMNPRTMNASHMKAKALRYTIKLFLAHYHDSYWRAVYGEEPVNPYPK